MLGVTIGSLYVDTQGYIPVLLKNLHGMSCFVTYWLLGGVGFRVGMDAFEWSLIT